MRIIPAIDIIDGKCVRLTMGDYSKMKIYNEDPLEVAKQFEDHGIKYLHLVDLDGARSKRIVNWKVLQRISSKTKLSVDFGGGIKSKEDLELAFDNGASQLTAGSIASQKPDLFLSWLERYGPGKIILGADCKNRLIMTDGWTASSGIDVVDYIKDYLNRGVKSVICTDIGKDGMLMGPSFELYEEIIATTESSLIASGGINSIADIKKLKQLGCEGAILGKAIYEGRIKLKKLSELC